MATQLSSCSDWKSRVPFESGWKSFESFSLSAPHPNPSGSCCPTFKIDTEFKHPLPPLLLSLWVNYHLFLLEYCGGWLIGQPTFALAFLKSFLYIATVDPIEMYQITSSFYPQLYSGFLLHPEWNPKSLPWPLRPPWATTTFILGPGPLHLLHSSHAGHTGFLIAFDGWFLCLAHPFSGWLIPSPHENLCSNGTFSMRFLLTSTLKLQPVAPHNTILPVPLNCLSLCFFFNVYLPPSLTHPCPPGILSVVFCRIPSAKYYVALRVCPKYICWTEWLKYIFEGGQNEDLIQILR